MKNTQTGDEQGKRGGDTDDVKLAESDETEKQKGKENNAEKAEAGDGKPAITEQWSQIKLKKEYRKFNLDLAPKVIFLQNPFVYIGRKL